MKNTVYTITLALVFGSAGFMRSVYADHLIEVPANVSAQFDLGQMREVSLTPEQSSELEQLVHELHVDSDVVFLTRSFSHAGLAEVQLGTEKAVMPVFGVAAEFGMRLWNTLELGAFGAAEDVAILIIELQAGLYARLDLGDLVYIKGRFYTVPAILSFAFTSDLNAYAGGSVGVNIAQNHRIELFSDQKIGPISSTTIQYYGLRYVRDL